MLVVVMLSGIGMVALNAASYDVASAGAVRQGIDAESVAEGGLILARTEMCRSIDGIVLAMSSMRTTQGRAPQFDLEGSALEARLDEGERMFALPTKLGGRGSFGNLLDPARPPTPPQVTVTIDRPRESSAIAGYSLREAAGSDSSSFCFRNYRVTSRGLYVPIGGDSYSTRAEQRAFIVAGPLECTM
jgi:hypothetical protein